MPTPLEPAALRWTCPPESLNFETTDEVAAEERIVGQERAYAALTFGLALRSRGHNLFVRGEEGTGRLTLVKRLLAKPVPLPSATQDRVMVLDFDQLDRPALLSLPLGSAPAFKTGMAAFVKWIDDDLIDEVQEASALEKRAMDQAASADADERTAPFQERLAAANLALVQMVDDDGDKETAIVPILNGEPVPLDKLEEGVAAGTVEASVFEAAEAAIEVLGEELFAMQGMLKALERQHDRAVQELLDRKTRESLQEHAAPVRQAWPDAAVFIDQVVEHVAKHMELLDEEDVDLCKLYEVNVLLTRAQGSLRPVVVESAPSMQALLGTIDAPITEGTAPHMGVYAGALLRADGGTLVLNARSVLREDGAWEALTRTIRSGELRLLPDDQPTTLRPPGIKPAAIPVDVKVVLIGDPETYYLLDQNDPDFPNLFKVLADFESVLPADAASIGHYAKVIGQIVRRDGLPPFDRSAVAALVEHGATLADEGGHLTTRFGRIADITREAAWLAKGPIVHAEDVSAAIAAGKARAGGPSASFHERVQSGALRLLTEGSTVGELNGLAVISAGPLSFGMPVRITGSAGPGSSGPLNVEHEASLSGQIHVKSFHILTGLLRRLLDCPHPLGLDASIAFEQSYGGIDGDSASGASFCVLLSAITALPVRQDLAMTGAVDQIGSVLPIGGVNEKIEGFFDVCVPRGLSGTQGVIVPRTNTRDLMLRPDIVAAAADGRFHVYAIEHIREAIELFFDRPANEVLDAARERLEAYWSATREPSGGGPAPVVTTDVRRSAAAKNESSTG